MLQRSRQSATEAILMETVFRPCHDVADPARVLDLGEKFLSVDGGLAVEQVAVGPGALCEGGFGGVRQVESDEDGAEDRGWDVLNVVHPLS